ncbi:MAG TPA: hypothetical protein VFO76_01820 [Candidatus Kapabacteria bacterium]|nr:hypothetical protein [Candidatus Kapabacteria bacterium]
MEKHNLTLRIKRIWLEEIVFGKKKIEFRDNSEFYAQRLMIYRGDDEIPREFECVEFYCPIGATGKILRATVEFKKTICNLKKNCFEIHLGKIISHNLPKPRK